VGGEGADTITAPQSETKAIILGDLGQARFDALGILTGFQIAAYNSPDSYRIDGGLASSTLQLLEDTRVWIGRNTAGAILRTQVDFVGSVNLNGSNLVLLFHDGFNHETDRKEGEDVPLFSGIIGKFDAAAGLFRNGDLTYDLVEGIDPNNAGSNTIRLRTLRIPGAGDRKLHLYLDSLSGQDEVGMGFTDYFFREPAAVGRILMQIDGLAYLDGVFEFRESKNATDSSKDTWAFVSTNVEGGLVTGQDNKIFVGFRRGAGVTVTGSPGASTTNDTASNATDGDFSTKYLNVNGAGSGLILSMATATTVTSMTLTTRTDNDIWEWDPSVYQLYGANGAAAPAWGAATEKISSGSTVPHRHPKVQSDRGFLSDND
jgi:hypothetical protein